MKKAKTILFVLSPLCLTMNSFGATQNSQESETIPSVSTTPLRPDPPCYLQKSVGEGYVNYELGARQGEWEASICDLTEDLTRPHFHKKMESHFIVLEGSALVTLDGESQILMPGQHVHIARNVVHSIMSADPATSVRCLCASFPAYDPTDVYLLPKGS